MKSLPQLIIAIAGAALLPAAHPGGLSPHAYATMTQVDYYRRATQQELVSCGEIQASLRRNAASERGDASCIAISQLACRTRLQAALQEVRKPDAREALRAYHYAFVAALNGVAPQNNEPRDGYQRRQQELQHLLAHAWTRFELAE